MDVDDIQEQQQQPQHQDLIPIGPKDPISPRNYDATTEIYPPLSVNDLKKMVHAGEKDTYADCSTDNSTEGDHSKKPKKKAKKHHKKHKKQAKTPTPTPTPPPPPRKRRKRSRHKMCARKTTHLRLPQQNYVSMYDNSYNYNYNNNNNNNNNNNHNNNDKDDFFDDFETQHYPRDPSRYNIRESGRGKPPVPSNDPNIKEEQPSSMDDDLAVILAISEQQIQSPVIQSYPVPHVPLSPPDRNFTIPTPQVVFERRREMATKPIAVDNLRHAADQLLRGVYYTEEHNFNTQPHKHNPFIGDASYDFSLAINIQAQYQLRTQELAAIARVVRGDMDFISKSFAYLIARLFEKQFLKTAFIFTFPFFTFILPLLFILISFQFKQTQNKIKQPTVQKAETITQS